MLSLLDQDKCEDNEDRKKTERCCLFLQIFEEGSNVIRIVPESKISISGFKLQGEKLLA